MPVTDSLPATRTSPQWLARVDGGASNEIVAVETEHDMRIAITLDARLDEQDAIDWLVMAPPHTSWWSSLPVTRHGLRRRFGSPGVAHTASTTSHASPDLRIRAVCSSSGSQLQWVTSGPPAGLFGVVDQAYRASTMSA